MHRLIKKVPGSKIYLAYSSGYEKEDLRKIGFSNDPEKRKKSYVSNGNLINIMSERSWCDKVDESMFHSYFYRDAYDDGKDIPNGRLRELFYPIIENAFKEVCLSKVYSQVFLDFIKLIEINSNNNNINLFYLLEEKHNRLDLKSLGLDATLIYGGDSKDYSLGVWLYSEPLKIKSAGFWRSVIYKLGKDFDSIIKNAEYLSDKSNSQRVRDIYNLISDKLYCIKQSFSLSGLSKEVTDKVCELYLSYCSSFDISIRMKLEDEMFKLINESEHV